MLQRLAFIKSAAEFWASCMANETTGNETCHNLTQIAMEDMVGSGDLWTPRIVARVMKLGQALLDGIDTVLVYLKLLDVLVESSASNCSDSVLDAIADQVENVSSIFKPHPSGAPRNATRKICQLVYGRPNYGLQVEVEELNDTEIEELADEVVVQVLPSGGRRLSTASYTTYASQDVEDQFHYYYNSLLSLLLSTIITIICYYIYYLSLLLLLLRLLL